MNAPLISRRDLDFLLYEWLDVESLLGRSRFEGHSREIFDAFIDVSESLAERYFRPHNREADEHEPSFDGARVHLLPGVAKALRSFADADMFAATLDEAHDGLQLPETVAAACYVWFQAANAGTTSYPFLTIAAARLLAAHGSRALHRRFLAPMTQGRFFGTMCLSEPHAGSSLADITTTAKPQPDGTYRLTGSKMWISAGDHDLSENIVHMVLARVAGAPPGVKGISLFVVPKHLEDAEGAWTVRNDVNLVGLNHKMGFRGAVNTVLAFGDGAHRPSSEPGAVGYLVGDENDGLSYMFHMMNEARIGVGLCATALGYAGYLCALDYARSRPQGRPLGVRDPRSPQVPIVEHPDVRRMLLIQKAYVEGALALSLYASRLVDDVTSSTDPRAQRDAQLMLEVLTPVVKSWPSQWCLEANSLAIQVLGGAGYTRDYPVEQYYRDNRLNMIHEGTHGIQGLDLLGRKVTQDDGLRLLQLVSRINATCDRAASEGGELREMATELAQRGADVQSVAALLGSHSDRALAMSNSTAFLESLGHVVLAWIWLEQLLAAEGKHGDFYDGKRQAARYFFRWELPRVDLQLQRLRALDDTVLKMADEWF